MLKQMTLAGSVIAGFALLMGSVQAKPDDGKLRFFLQPSTSVIPHIVEWQQLTKDFAASDPEIASVELVTLPRDLDEAHDQVDCAYTFNNYVPFVDLDWLQPLDAYLDSDTALDRGDVLDRVWSHVTRNEHVYGYPLTLMPLMMWYWPEAFEDAGVPVPQNGWSVQEFLDTLKALKASDPHVVSESRGFGAQFYLMMASALGTPVVDYSTSIPTYHLTDADVRATLQTLLDLSRDGLHTYNPLDVFSESTPWRYDEDSLLYDAWGPMSNTDGRMMPVTFPQGDEFVPTSYYLGAGYIMAQTPYGEACYRWLSTISQHPELLNEMPARRSQVSNAALIALQGQAISDTYTSVFEQLDSPNEDFVAAGLATNTVFPGAIMMHIWFTQALDDVVLNGVELETSLAEAQSKIDTYTDCVSKLTPMQDVGEDKTAQLAYSQDIKACTLSIDPELTYMFNRE